MLKVDEFRNKITKALSADPLTDAIFGDMIYAALTDLGVPETDFRDQYGLSAGTVERWSQGQNLPLPPVRRAILEWLYTHLAAH